MPRQGAAAGRYRMSDQGQPTQRGLQGMYLLRDNAGCQVYRPTWNGTRTIFRPFPAKDPDNPQAWDPFRLSDEAGDFGDWIRRYDVAFSLGNPGITFVAKSPFDPDDAQNPVNLLHRSINQAVKSGTGDPSWNPLIFGAKGRSAPLSPYKDGYVMQGILMEHKSNPQNPPRGSLPEHQPVVFLMSQSAGAALLEKLNERNQEGKWAWPDITSLDAGMFVQFHQAGTQHNAGAGSAPRQMGQQGPVGGGIAENNSYEVEFLELYNGISPTFPTIQQLAETHVRSWDDIVRTPTPEEQIRLICSAGIPASAIVYALGDIYRDAIPQHIWDQANATRQQSTVPFNQPQGGGSANPMQQTQESPFVSPSTPPAETAAPVAQSPTQPATGDNVQSEPAPSPEAQGFDAQPQHTTQERATSTIAALQAARERAAQNS